MSKKCEFRELPSGDAFGGLLCTTCAETFEKEPVCPKQGSLPTKQEWDGEAFPIPSGAKCEVQMGSFWYPGTVIASTTEAAWFKSDHDGDFWTIMNGLSIRPLRTKEQRERDELADLIKNSGACWSKDIAEVILSKYNLEPKQ